MNPRALWVGGLAAGAGLLAAGVVYAVNKQTVAATVAPPVQQPTQPIQLVPIQIPVPVSFPTIPAAPVPTAPVTTGATQSVLLSPVPMSVTVAPNTILAVNLPQGATWSPNNAAASPPYPSNVTAVATQVSGNSPSAVTYSGASTDTQVLEFDWIDWSGNPQTTQLSLVHA